MPLSQVSDDLIHVPEPNPGWRESYYFDFYDPKLGLGMWHSAGKRPFKGHSGYALGAWGLHTLAGIGLDHFTEHTEECVVGGLRYECVEPLKRWRTTFDGELGIPTKLQPRLDIRCMLPEGQAEMQRVRVKFDLMVTSISPAYTYKDLPHWKPLFSGHLDQIGRTTGSMTIGDATYEIDAVGGRDRSWGTRDWTYPRMWRFVSLVREGFDLMLWYTEADPDLTMVDGYVKDGDAWMEVVGYKEAVRTEPAPGKPVPRSVTFEVATANGRTYRVEGEVMQIMPVLFDKKKDGVAVTCWNDRALVRYTLPNGDVAYGNIEFGERVASRS